MLKRIARLLFGGEFWFAFFLFSGYIKNSLAFLPVDASFVLMGLTMAFAARKVFAESVFPRRYIPSGAIFLLLAAFMLVSYIYSSSEYFALNKLIRFYLLTGWSFFGVYLLLRTREAVQRFFTGVIAVSLIMSVAAAISFHHMFKSGMYIGQINVLGSDYLALGRTNGLGALLIIILLMYPSGIKLGYKLLGGVLALFTLFTLGISGSRMPLIAFFLCLFVLMGLSLYRERGKVMVNKGLYTICAFLFTILLIAVPLYSAGVFETAALRFTTLAESNNGGASASGRIDRYEVAGDMIVSDPILGNGIGSFNMNYQGLDSNGYPHNIFLELFSEMGVVGVILGSLLFLRGMAAVRRRPGEDSRALILRLGVFIGFLFLFLNANVSGDLNENRVLFTFIALCDCIAEFVPFTSVMGGSWSCEQKSVSTYR